MAFLSLLLASAVLAQEPILHGHVVGVTDGDTIKVLVAENQLLRIRIAWIDAPELGQAFGNRAKQAMSALVFGKEVQLHAHTIDRYGRTVAVVIVEGKDAGLELIRQGLAWAYERYLLEASSEIQTEYLAAETAARVTRQSLRPRSPYIRAGRTMSLLDTITKGRRPRYIWALIYGTDGVGKSTMCSHAPNPIFVGAEKGTEQLDVARFPRTE